MSSIADAGLALKVAWIRGVRTLQFFTAAVRLAYQLSDKVDPRQFRVDGNQLQLNGCCLHADDLSVPYPPAKEHDNVSTQ